MPHTSMIDPLALRIFVYDEIVARGLPPKSSEIASHFGTSADIARREIGALKIGKTILPDPKSGEIWMAGPFSSAQTPYQVVRDSRRWWANCAWDMLGIPMILKERATVTTGCTDCGSPLTVDCDPNTPPTTDAVVHFFVPARSWYEDIGFT